MVVHTTRHRKFLIVCGTSGSGKTEVAIYLGARLGWTVIDADELHTNWAREMINRGQNVGEDYRHDWLERVIGAVWWEMLKGQNVIVACSALQPKHRAMLLSLEQELGPGAKGMCAWLKVSKETLHHRLTERDKQGEHFATVKLLDSQLAIMREPTSNEKSVVVIDGEIGSVCEISFRVWNTVDDLHALKLWACDLDDMPQKRGELIDP